MGCGVHLAFELSGFFVHRGSRAPSVRLDIVSVGVIAFYEGIGDEACCLMCVDVWIIGQR